jgi:hypothetical protein
LVGIRNISPAAPPTVEQPESYGDLAVFGDSSKSKPSKLCLEKTGRDDS